MVERNEITILRHYTDRVCSAKADNRPEIQNRIWNSGKRLFDIIILWKLDSFHAAAITGPIQGHSENERGQGGGRHRGHF